MVAEGESSPTISVSVVPINSVSMASVSSGIWDTEAGAGSEESRAGASEPTHTSGMVGESDASCEFSRMVLVIGLARVVVR